MKKMGKVFVIAAAYVASVFAAEHFGVGRFVDSFYSSFRQRAVAGYGRAKSSLHGILLDNPEVESGELLESIEYYGGENYNGAIDNLVLSLNRYRSDEQRRAELLDFISSHPEVEEQIFDDALPRMKHRSLEIVSDLYDGMSDSERMNSVRYGISLLPDRDFFILELTNHLAPENRNLLFYKSWEERLDGVKNDGRQMVRDIVRELRGK